MDLAEESENPCLSYQPLELDNLNGTGMVKRKRYSHLPNRD